MLGLNEKAPAFELPSALNGRVSMLRLADVRSEWIVLFFYPRDFSFVCPTEVSGFHRSLAAFEAENSVVLGVSVDSVESHMSWARELGGIGYPLLSDEGGKTARAFGVLDERERAAHRATFILRDDRTVAYAMASPVNVGRSVNETLRVLRALRTGRLCPAEWMPGMDFGPADLKF
jgi:peroxiredoxin (alkyl hydroperoxide reductase subunit C)